MSAITGPPVCKELGGLFYDNYHEPVQAASPVGPSLPPSPTFARRRLPPLKIPHSHALSSTYSCSPRIAITDDSHEPALLSTRNRLRRAVRRGAGCTVDYHLQPTVAAVARPVRRSVVPLVVLAAERSWLLLAQTASAWVERPAGIRRSASSPWPTLPGRPPWHRRRSVSSMRCPPVRCRRPGSGGPAVRCPARPVSGHPGWSSGVRRSGRLLSTRPASTRLVSTRPVSSRLVSAPVRPDASVSFHTGRWRWDQAGAAGQPSPQERVESLWAAAPSSGSVDGRGGLGVGDAAEVARWSVGGRWRSGRVGCGRPRVTG
jgi:hypothetical protein